MAPDRSRLWLLYALLVTYAASVVVFYVFARYRYPLVPFLILFAAAGAVHAGLQPHATLLRWQTLAAVAVAAVFANWPMLSSAWMQAVTEGNLGAALQSEQRLDEAAAHYRRAIAFRPDYAAAYSNLGTALRAQGRLDEAVATYERALALQPDFPDAHYNLANALTDQGKAGAAIEHFQVALRVIPGSAEVHNNLGIALAADGKPTKPRRNSGQRWPPIPIPPRPIETSAICSPAAITGPTPSTIYAAPPSSCPATPRRTTISEACCSRRDGWTKRSRNSARRSRLRRPPPKR